MCINLGVIVVLVIYGYIKVWVVWKLIVVVIVIGSELFEVEDEFELGKIWNLNGLMIKVLVK